MHQTRNQVEMIALRPFSRMTGDAIVRMKNGDKFYVEPAAVRGLEASGKASRVEKEPPVRRFTKATED